jgi:metal-sulfur cluster biosynthetic enzyme
MSRALAHASWSVDGALGELVHEHLQQVIDPCSAASVLPMSILELGLIRDVELVEGSLVVHLRLTSPSCMMVAYLAREVTTRLVGLPGVTRIEVRPDEGLDWEPDLIDADRAAERERRLVHLQLSRPPVS